MLSIDSMWFGFYLCVTLWFVSLLFLVSWFGVGFVAGCFDVFGRSVVRLVLVSVELLGCVGWLYLWFVTLILVPCCLL